MIILILIMLVFAIFIGLLMELYKKKIRKDKASDWENWIVAFALSAIFGSFLYGIAIATDNLS